MIHCFNQFPRFVSGQLINIDAVTFCRNFCHEEYGGQCPLVLFMINIAWIAHIMNKPFQLALNIQTKYFRSQLRYMVQSIQALTGTQWNSRCRTFNSHGFPCLIVDRSARSASCERHGCHRLPPFAIIQPWPQCIAGLCLTRSDANEGSFLNINTSAQTER